MESSLFSYLLKCRLGNGTLGRGCVLLIGSVPVGVHQRGRLQDRGRRSEGSILIPPVLSVPMVVLRRPASKHMVLLSVQVAFCGLSALRSISQYKHFEGPCAIRLGRGIT